MALSKQTADPYVSQLQALSEDAAYSAQTYFEASKSAEFWGRAIVFVPALLGAIAGVIVALSGVREWGAVGAVAGAVAATASFLGSDRKAASFKDSAKKFTNLRHRATMEVELASRQSSEEDLAAVLRSLRKEYEAVVLVTEPAPSNAFSKAQSRIKAGVLEYDTEASPTSG
jgi:hypothetical protein